MICVEILCYALIRVILRTYFCPLQFINIISFKIDDSWDFPGGPVVKTLPSHCTGCEFDPWFGELRSHMPHSQKTKT